MLLHRLQQDHPQLDFTPGTQFRWSPLKQQILFVKKQLAQPQGYWTILHELSHALLGHQGYSSDLDLVRMESAAWEHAHQLAEVYELSIPNDYIQNCLDTYRDWLHLRSACPRCTTHSLQQNEQNYACYNCGHAWRVSTSRFCRPYRMSQNKTASAQTEKTLFA